jgi:5'-nucleotidase
MTWLLTNDDGVFAPGLTALARSLKSQPFLVVAPQSQYSGCGHQVTTHAPLQVARIADSQFGDRTDQVFGLNGTPADCVRVARFHLAPAIAFVLSGINAGGNMGADCHISGTIAAVREAALHGIPGIAVSQYHRRSEPIDWEQASRWTTKVLETLLPLPLKPGSFWNVNFPHLDKTNTTDPEIVFCVPSQRPLPVSFRVEGDLLYYQGVYALRDREPGSDVDVCLGGQIAVTQLSI